MRGVWRIIFVIPVSFLAASLAAGMIITLAAGAQPNPGEATGDFLAKLLLVSVFASMFVGAVAGIPALIAIVLAELFGWRSLILHLVIGAGIGLSAFLLGIGGGEPPAARSDLQLGAAAGAVAGFVYWLIAGRKAGLTPDDG